MTEAQARTWILKATLWITAVDVVFFTIAPAFGYPLTYPEAFRMLQIVLPVFFAYLGSAAHFLFKSTERKRVRRGRADNELLAGVVKGPVYLFLAGSLGAVVAFGWLNRRAAVGGGTMGIEELAWIMSFLLGLMTGVTNYVVSQLYGNLAAASEPGVTGSQLENEGRSAHRK